MRPVVLVLPILHFRHVSSNRKGDMIQKLSQRVWAFRKDTIILEGEAAIAHCAGSVAIGGSRRRDGLSSSQGLPLW